MRRTRSLAAAGVVLAVLVVSQVPAWPYQTLPASVLPPSLAQAMPGGDPVVATYPYESYNDQILAEPMSWQDGDAYSFRILAGYAYTRGPDGAPTLLAPRMDPSGMQEFLAAQAGVFVYGPPLPVSATLVATTRATLTAYDIRAVIVDRSWTGSGQVVQLFDDALGPPTAVSGTLVMWAGWAGSAGT